jgi:hypothetical protein
MDADCEGEGRGGYGRCIRASVCASPGTAPRGSESGQLPLSCGSENSNLGLQSNPPGKRMAIVADSAGRLRGREEYCWPEWPPQSRGCWRFYTATVLIHLRQVFVYLRVLTQLSPVERSIERLTPTMTYDSGSRSPVNSAAFGRDNVTHIPFLTLRQHFRPICASWIPCPLELLVPFLYGISILRTAFAVQCATARPLH